MPYTLKLPDGTLVSDIPDDVPPNTAYANIAAQIPAFEKKLRRSTAKDLGKDLVAGAYDVGKIVTKDIPELVGLGSNRVGDWFEQQGKATRGEQSAATQLERMRIQQALTVAEKEGLGSEVTEAIKQYATNPHAALGVLASNAPQIIISLLTGGAAGAASKGLQLGAKAAGRVAVGTAVGTNAVMQGGDVGGDTLAEARQIWAQNPGLFRAMPEFRALVASGKSEAEAAEAIALSAARKAGGIAGGLSAVLGVTPIGGAVERAFLGKAGTKGVLKGAGATLTKEGLGEFTEEFGGKVGSNAMIQGIDPSRGLYEGAGTAGVQGLIGGAGMGAVGGAYSGYRGEREKAKEEAARKAEEAKRLAPLLAEEAAIKAQIGEVDDNGQYSLPSDYMPAPKNKVPKQLREYMRAPDEESFVAPELPRSNTVATPMQGSEPMLSRLTTGTEEQNRASYNAHFPTEEADGQLGLFSEEAGMNEANRVGSKRFPDRDKIPQFQEDMQGTRQLLGAERKAKREAERSIDEAGMKRFPNLVDIAMPVHGPNIVPQVPAAQVVAPAPVAAPVPETPAEQGVVAPEVVVITPQDLKKAGLSGNTNKQRALRELLLGKDPNADVEAIKDALYSAFVNSIDSGGVPRYLQNLMDKFGYDPEADTDRQSLQQEIETPTAPPEPTATQDVPRETPVEPAPVPVAEQPQAPAELPSAPPVAPVVTPPAPFKKSRARKTVDPVIQAARDFYDENRPEGAPAYVDLHPKAKETFDAFADPETPGYKGLSQIDVDEIAKEHNEYTGQDPDAFINQNKDVAPVPADEATTVEQGIEGKEAVDVAKWLAKNAPSEDYRLIASKVATKLADMERAGVVYSFEVVHEGGPEVLKKSRGAVHYNAGSTDPNNPRLATIDIYINGSDRKGRVGTSYKTVLHELIHAALIPLARLGTMVVGKNSTAAQPTRRLIDALAAITAEIKAKEEASKAGTYRLTAFERLLAARDINAINTVDELIAWSLTDRNMQKWLSGIQYTPKQSLWRALFEAIRGFFGIPTQSSTALEEVLTATEELFNVPAQEMAAVANEAGWAMDQSVAPERAAVEGPAKAPLTEEELIRRETPSPESGLRKMSANFLDTIFGNTVKLKKRDGTVVETKLPSAFETGVADSKARLRAKFDALGNPIIGESGKLSGIALADYADSTIPTLAQGVLEYGPLKFNEVGRPIVDTDNPGPNYIQVMDSLSAAAKAADMPITRAVGMLNAALKGKRAAAVMSNDIEANARVRNLGIPPEEQALGDKIWNENPWIAETYNIMRAHLNGQIDAMVEAGKIPQVKAQEWKDATYYVPFLRVFNESMLDNANSSVAGLNSPMNVVRTLIGGKEPLKDVLTGMMDQSMFMTAAAIKSNAARAIGKQAYSLGLAAWVKKPHISGEGSKNYDVKFYEEDGSERGVRFFDREDALAIGSTTQELGPLMTLFQKTSALLRAGIVRMPDFAVRDLARNSSQAYYFSGDQSGIVKTMMRVYGNAAKNWGQHAKQLAGGQGNYSDVNKALKSAGLAGGYNYIGDMHEMDSVRSRFGLLAGTSTKLFRKMMDAVYIDTDMANKENLVKQLEAQGASREEAMYRAYGMAPFSQRGRWPIVRTIASMAPFIQANIKGLHVLSLMIRGNASTIPVEQRQAVKQMFWRRGAYTALLIGVYAMLMDDDEIYNAESPSSRDMNLIIPISEHEGLRMPIAPEAALLFKIPVERMVRWMMGKDDAWRGIGGSLMDNYNPLWGIMPGEGGPQLIKPWVELAAGKSLHSGAPIVPMRLQGLDPKEQYTADTTEVAKMIGSLFSHVPGAPEWTQSPVKVEHMVRGVLGNAAMFGLQMSSAMVDAVWGGDNQAPSRPATRMAGLSSMFASDVKGNQQAIFYELKQQADRAAKTWKDLQTKDKDAASEYFDEHKAIIEGKKLLDGINGEIVKLRKEQRKMLADPEIGADEKSNLRDEFTRAINTRASEARILVRTLE